MTRCPVCSLNLINDQRIINHYKDCHQHLRNFSCIFDICLRTYDSWNSFHKHWRTYHKVDSKNPVSDKKIQGIANSIETSVKSEQLFIEQKRR